MSIFYTCSNGGYSGCGPTNAETFGLVFKGFSQGCEFRQKVFKLEDPEQVLDYVEKFSVRSRFHET